MTEKEYIERDKALEIVKRTSGDYAAAWSEISRLPAATDTVKVVRCKDCEHYGLYGVCKLHSEDADRYSTGAEVKMEADDYCSYGARKRK